MATLLNNFSLINERDTASIWAISLGHEMHIFHILFVNSSQSVRKFNNSDKYRTVIL